MDFKPGDICQIFDRYQFKEIVQIIEVRDQEVIYRFLTGTNRKLYRTHCFSVRVPSKVNIGLKKLEDSTLAKLLYAEEDKKG
jgi:hypothetical protein